MRKWIAAVLIFASVFAFAAGAAYAREEADVPQYLEQALRDITAHAKAKGVIVSVVQNGEVTLCAGYGDADAYMGIAADGETTAFRIGSISKTFVAVAAEILHQEGKLTMDADIARYLEPDFPKLQYPVTMHHLLTHTAGFEDRVTGMAVKNVSDTEPLSVSVRKYLPAQVFAPGEVVSYSNYGIALAGYVVERIAGMDFAQFCRERIFLPLGMRHTTFAHMHDTAYVSKAYLPNGGQTMEPYMNLYPEGSAVSTAGDMAEYMLWLLDSGDVRVLEAEYKSEMFDCQFTMDEALGGVGYTWNRKLHNGEPCYDKKGETLHFYSRIALYPSRQAGVFLSFNTYVPANEIDAMLRQVTQVLYGPELTAAVPADSATFNISGFYANNWSSFKTPEKLLRYIVPGKLVRISGSESEGYTLNGEKLILTGEDTYDTPMGRLKFLQRGGGVLMATESAITYSRVTWADAPVVQLLMPAWFLLAVLMTTAYGIVTAARRRTRGTGKLPLMLSVVQLLAFGALAILLYTGIAGFRLLSYTLPIAACAILIVAGTAGAIYSAVKNAKTVAAGYRLLLLHWCIASAAFCVWLIGMRML